MRAASTGVLLATLGGAALLAGAGVLGREVLASKTDPDPPHLHDEVPVTGMDQGVGAANNSPTLLADPTDARFVVLANRLDAPDFSCALQVSGDSGQSWMPAQPVPELPQGAEKCYAPEIGFDRDGVLYYLFVGLAGLGNQPMGVFLITSADRAQSFSPPRQVLGPLNFSVRMAIDPRLGDRGRIHLAWLQANSDPTLGGFGPPPNPLLAAYSDDGGNTFSEPVQVNDPYRERVVAPALALGADHAVHVAYYDLGRDAVDYQGLEGPIWAGTWQLVVATSPDGGRHFRPGVVAEPAITPPERVMLIFTMAAPALVAQGERLCLAWPDARNADADVFVRCTSEREAGWGQPLRLNDDPVGSGRSQYLPRLAAAPGGRIDAIFYDRRNDPQNVNNDVYYTFSTDGGRSFAPNIQLNRSGSSFSRIGPQYANPSARGQVEFGSRLALLSRRHDALAAWTDTRNQRPMRTDQDIFATRVSFPRDVGPWRAVPLGSVFVIAGGISLATAFVLRREGRKRPVKVEA